MKIKNVIIGGGVAGLCAAIRLGELGEESLVIEGGSYPAHKICGEFLSPECLNVLHSWDIYPSLIQSATLTTSKKSLNFSFPRTAGAMSHIQLDPALASSAIKRGAKIKTETKVDSFFPKKESQGMHLLQLSSGETLQASNVMMATGRIPSYSLSPPLMTYMGFKTHFKDVNLKEHLAMFSFPGAYLGIAPIENNQCNIACIVKLTEVRKYHDPLLFIEKLIFQNPILHGLLANGKNSFDQWMYTQVPNFGIKKTPNWLDTYFIGDAASTIPPACGNGLSMAILGGKLAAEFCVKHQSVEFKKLWTKRCSSQILWGKLLHQFMLNPSLGNPFIHLANFFPSLSKYIYELTRQPSN